MITNSCRPVHLIGKSQVSDHLCERDGVAGPLVDAESVPEIVQLLDQRFVGLIVDEHTAIISSPRQLVRVRIEVAPAFRLTPQEHPLREPRC